MKAGKVISLGEKLMIRDLQEKLGYITDTKETETCGGSEDLYKESQEKRQCIFCGSKKQLFFYMDKYYCYNCYLELQDL
ncbi:MAG: hypothetical protein ACOCQH_03925 [Halanaerobiales bacterium]